MLCKEPIARWKIKMYFLTIDMFDHEISPFS